MASEESDVLESLTAAIADLNSVAQDPAATVRTKRRAIRRFCDSLDEVVRCEELWDRLSAVSDQASPPGLGDEAWALLDTVAVELSDAFKEMLRRVGYRTPPPPTIHELVTGVRAAVRWESQVDGQWGIDHIETARSMLRTFVVEVRYHLRWWRSNEQVDAALAKCRKPGAVALLVFVALRTEITFGDEFDLSLGVSLREYVKVEITVPVLLPEGISTATVHAALVNTQVTNLVWAMDGPPRDIDLRPPRRPPPGRPSAPPHAVEQPSDTIQPDHTEDSSPRAERAPYGLGTRTPAQPPDAATKPSRDGNWSAVKRTTRDDDHPPKPGRPSRR